MSHNKLVRVGLIGCGEVAQVVHIPTLNHMSDFFRITYLCDVSQQALEHCASKVSHASAPRTTKSAEEVCSSADVDVVFVINSTEFHPQHTILALKNDKIAFVEKPLALCERDVREIKEAERASKGTVMVGYMRRYAEAFDDALKEIEGMDQILYATVRDIIGQNPIFVGQSAAFPRYFSDQSAEDNERLKQARDSLLREGLSNDLGIEVTKDTSDMWMFLGTFGSHDLSAMREALGSPQAVVGCSLRPSQTFWNTLFQYKGFVVSYESGIHNVPIFDAHIEVFSKSKQVKIKYDTPFVKGLPITMTVRENYDGHGAFRETVLRRTYEDPYTLEMRQLYALVTAGKPVKTTVDDAAEDLKTYQMIMKAGVPGMTK